MSKANIHYQTREKIASQVLSEIQFARDFKQGKVRYWKKNEDLYYSRKVTQETSRANVDLGQMASFVHTILAKVDNPLTFKFIKRKLAQLKRVERLNSLKTYDADRDNWDIKDIAGKKQAIIYGRAIYSYYADSKDGYCPHLDPVDVYDFLIDPSAGGLDVEKAMYLGDYGVVLTRDQLEQGIKDGIYHKTETRKLLDGGGNANETTQEETNKEQRTRDTKVWTAEKEMDNKDKFKFWRWGTTYKGERYYVLITEIGGTAIRVEKVKDIFESGLWWYWTYAAFPDLTEFWTPSFCDYVRDVFMAQSVSINQMLDNAEAINKPQRKVNINMIENLKELSFRRDGLIKVKGDFDVNKAYQIVEVKSIDTPLLVYDKLDLIQEKASGVTAGAKGVADEDKVGIYEGNQANAAERFGFFNKSYSFGYKRFAKLWECGVREHLKKKVAVDIIGPDGVELEEIGYKDIFRKNDSFGLMVESSDAEMTLSEIAKKTKLTFLANNAENPVQNPKKAYEISSNIVGFTDDETRQLMDTSEFGDAEMMSEAERDIEAILDGKNIQPNQIATAAYLQRFIDYARDNQENITQEQFLALTGYMASLEPIIMRNMVRQGNQALMNQTLAASQPVDINSQPPVTQEQPYAI